jgi:hypothetical protein
MRLRPKKKCFLRLKKKNSVWQWSEADEGKALV